MSTPNIDIQVPPPISTVDLCLLLKQHNDLYKTPWTKIELFDDFTGMLHDTSDTIYKEMPIDFISVAHLESILRQRIREKQEINHGL